MYSDLRILFFGRKAHPSMSDGQPYSEMGGIFGSVKNLINTPISIKNAITEMTIPHIVVSSAKEISPANASGSASPVSDSSPKAPTIPTTVPTNPNNGGTTTPVMEIQIALNQNFLLRLSPSTFESIAIPSLLMPFL